MSLVDFPQAGPLVQGQRSEIIEKYIHRYAEYTDQRYYALGFKLGGQGALESIANQKDKGYYCLVAAYAFEALESAGVETGRQPGMYLHNYDEQLWVILLISITLSIYQMAK